MTFHNCSILNNLLYLVKKNIGLNKIPRNEYNPNLYYYEKDLKEILDKYNISYELDGVYELAGRYRGILDNAIQNKLVPEYKKLHVYNLELAQDRINHMIKIFEEYNIDYE